MWLRPLEFIFSLTVLLSIATTSAFAVDRKDTTYVMNVWVERTTGIEKRLELRRYRERGRVVYRLFTRDGQQLEEVKPTTVERLKKISRWATRKKGTPYAKRKGGGFQRAKYVMPGLRIIGRVQKARAAFEVEVVRPGTVINAGLPIQSRVGSGVMTFSVEWKEGVIPNTESPLISKLYLKFLKEEPRLKRGKEYFLTSREGKQPIAVRFIRYIGKAKNLALVTSGTMSGHLGLHAYYFTVPAELLQHTGAKALKKHKKEIIKDSKLPGTALEKLRELRRDHTHNSFEPFDWRASIVYLGQNSRTTTPNKRLADIASALWNLNNNLAEAAKHLHQLKLFKALHNVPDDFFERLALSEHAPTTKEGWIPILKTLMETDMSGWKLPRFLLDRRKMVTKQFRVLAALFEAALELETKRVGARAAKKEGKSIIKERRDGIAHRLSFREQLPYEELINKIAPSWLRSFFLACARRAAP